MKKVMISFVALALMIACVKQNPEEEPSDKWNGYFKLPEDR